MPNRMLRDSALASKKLARVNAEAERLYWRLLMVADDFGRFDADPMVLRAKCFPRHGDAVTDHTVRSAWLDLVLAGLTLEYTVNGDTLGQFSKWDQRVRAEKSRFPGPECGQLRAVAREVRSSAAVDEDVDEDVVEGGGGDGALTLPPAHTFHEPEVPRRCSDCTALLALLRDVPVFFPELGEVGYSQVHAAHSVAGQARAVAAVRAQIERHRSGKIPKKFLAPAMLFDPKHWQVTINSVDDEARPRVIYPRV